MIKQGENTITKIYVGSTSVSQIYRGTDLVFGGSTPAAKSVTIDTNSQWQISDKGLTGYATYQSYSNKGVDSYGSKGPTLASIKITINNYPDFKLYIDSYSYPNYDYTLAWDLDTEVATAPTTASTGVKAYTYNSTTQKNPTSIGNYIEVDYSNDGGEHTIWVTYVKRSMNGQNDDRGYIAFPISVNYNSTEIRQTEYLKSGDKYYQKVYATQSEDGVTYYHTSAAATTGEELPTVLIKQTNDIYEFKSGSNDVFEVWENYSKQVTLPNSSTTVVETNIKGTQLSDYTPAANQMLKYKSTNGAVSPAITLTGIKMLYNNKAYDDMYIMLLSSPLTEYPVNFFNYKSGYFTYLEIPEGVTKIGRYAFSTASKLVDLVLPSTLTDLTEYFLGVASKLKTITCKATTAPTLGKTTFQNIAAGGVLYIPAGSDYSTWLATGGTGQFYLGNYNWTSQNITN